ncbi:MAG: hypothetical protein PVF58_07780 [Candidatus Methanofastidiosia archaeon]|jgi:hypothetical protein
MNIKYYYGSSKESKRHGDCFYKNTEYDKGVNTTKLPKVVIMIITEEELEEIKKMVKEKFSDDPALQQIYIARKIIAKKAEHAGLNYRQYITSRANPYKKQNQYINETHTKWVHTHCRT